MVKMQKCWNCRDAKQKCEPKGRRWDRSEQIKCFNCRKGNKPCGPDEAPPTRPPRYKRSWLLEGRDSSNTGSPKMTKESVEADPDSVKRKQSHMLSGSRRLRQSLKELEAYAEYANQVHDAFEEVIENKVAGYNAAIHCPEKEELAKLRETSNRNLLKSLKVVETFADCAQESGELDLAEIAYTRVLDIYRRQLSHFACLISELLLKMGEFYWKMGENLRAQKCWWDICKTRDPSGQAHCVEEEAWEKLLARKLPQAPRPNSDAPSSLRPIELKLDETFPPLHTMIKSEYGSRALKEKIGNEPPLDNAAASTAHSLLSLGGGSLAETIQSNRFLDLESKDILHRTALFVAASKKQEDAGYALVKRMVDLKPTADDQQQYMNERDIFGQTVLGAATESGCSVDFIKVLIERGAKVVPDPLQPFIYTPLQIACMTSNLELVKLFLARGGANVFQVFPGHVTPLQLAYHNADQRIYQLINKQTEEDAKDQGRRLY